MTTKKGGKSDVIRLSHTTDDKGRMALVLGICEEACGDRAAVVLTPRSALALAVALVDWANTSDRDEGEPDGPIMTTLGIYEGDGHDE